MLRGITHHNERNNTTLIVPLRVVDNQVHGFTCDGGTIPRPCWWFAHPFGRVLPAFVLHDYRWAMRNELGTTFRDSNDLLYDDCRLYGSVAEAWTIYNAVRLCGYQLWSRKKHVGDVAYHYAPIC